MEPNEEDIVPNKLQTCVLNIKYELDRMLGIYSSEASNRQKEHDTIQSLTTKIEFLQSVHQNDVKQKLDLETIVKSEAERNKGLLHTIQLNEEKILELRNTLKKYEELNASRQSRHEKLHAIWRTGLEKNKDVITKLQGNIDEQRVMYSRQESIYETLKHDYDVLLLKNQKLDKEVDAVKDANGHLKLEMESQVCNAQQTLRDIQDQLNSKERDFASLQISYDKLKDEFDATISDKQELNKVCERISATVTSLEIQLQDQVFNVQELQNNMKTELEQKKRDYASLQISFSSVSFDKQNLVKEIQTLRETVQSLELKIHDQGFNAQQMQSKLNDELHQQCRDFASLQINFSSVSFDKLNLEKEIQTLRGIVQSLELKIQEQTFNAKQMQSKLNDELEQKKRDYASLQISFSSVSFDKQNLEKEIKTLSGIVQSLELKIHDQAFNAQQMQSKLNDELQQLHEDLKYEVAKRESAEKLCVTKTKMETELNIKLTSAREMEETITNTLIQKDVQLQDLQLRFEKSQEIEGALITENQVANEEIVELKRGILVKEGKLADAVSIAENWKDKFSVTNDKLNALQNEYIELQGKYESLESGNCSSAPILLSEDHLQETYPRVMNESIASNSSTPPPISQSNQTIYPDSSSGGVDDVLVTKGNGISRKRKSNSLDQGEGSYPRTENEFESEENASEENRNIFNGRYNMFVDTPPKLGPIYFFNNDED